MAKKESTFTSMVLTLFLVTLGASGALGYVFEINKRRHLGSRECKEKFSYYKGAARIQ
jgi:hypothetical protein